MPRWLRWRQRMLVLLVLLAALAGSASCVIGKGNSVVDWRGLLKLGLVMPFSRYDTAIAYDALYGARLALRQWNARGGVYGYRVELVALDDENDARTAEHRARELAIDRDVVAVIGHLSSGALSLAADEYTRSQLPLVTFAPSSVAGKQYDLIRYLAPSYEEIASTVLLAFPEMARFAIAHEDEFGPWADAIEAAAPVLGKRVVSRQSLDGNQCSRGLDVGNKSRADVLIVLGAYHRAVPCLSAMRSSDVSTRLVFITDLPDKAMLDDKLAGSFLLTFWPLVDWQQDPARRFNAQFTASFQRAPGRYGIAAFDATNLVLDAIAQAVQHADRPSREEITARLKDYHGFQGLTGSLILSNADFLTSPKPSLLQIPEK